MPISIRKGIFLPAHVRVALAVRVEYAILATEIAMVLAGAGVEGVRVDVRSAGLRERCRPTLSIQGQLALVQPVQPPRVGSGGGRGGKDIHVLRRPQDAGILVAGRGPAGGDREGTPVEVGVHRHDRCAGSRPRGRGRAVAGQGGVGASLRATCNPDSGR